MVLAIWHILLQLAPWLLAGAAIAGLFHALLPADFLRRQLAGRWGVVKAAAIGVPMPLCSCSVIPVGLSLRRHGASAGATAAFLISTPETGVDSIFVSAGFFGWPFALFKLASAFAIGLAGGLLTDALASPKATDELPALDGPAATGDRWRRAFDHAIDVLHSLWLWLAVGMVISAAIETFMPPGGLERFSAYGGLAAMGMALAIGLPLYVCALASVPIAAALVNNGLPPGAALVFLIAGPATNVATMGAVLRTLGRRALIVYLATIVVGSVACGLAFDGLIPRNAVALGGHMHVESPAWWRTAAAITLVGLLAWFAAGDAARWIRRRNARGPALPEHGADQRRVVVAVTGMTCQNCVARLERIVSREAGVRAVEVTLEPGRLAVEGEITEPRLRELVAEAGFQAR